MKDGDEVEPLAVLLSLHSLLHCIALRSTDSHDPHIYRR